MNFTNIRIVVGVGALCLCSAAAAQLHWINPNGGNFSDPANWSPAKSPGPGDTVVFDLPAAYTVTVDGEFDIRPGSLQATGGDVTLSSQGGKLIVNGFNMLGAPRNEPQVTLDQLYVQVGKLTVELASLRVLHSAIGSTAVSSFGPAWTVTDGTLLVSGPNAWVCNCAFAADVVLLGESLAMASEGADIIAPDGALISDPDSLLIVEGSGSKAAGFDSLLKGLTIARDGATIGFGMAGSFLAEVHVTTGATLEASHPQIEWLEVSEGGKALMNNWYEGAGVARGPGTLIKAGLGGGGGIGADITVEDGAVVHCPYFWGPAHVVGSGRLEHPGAIEIEDLLELVDGGLVKTPLLKITSEVGQSGAGKLIGSGKVDGDLLVETWKGVAIGDPIGRIEVTGEVGIFGSTTAFDIQGPRPGIDHDVLSAGGEVYLHTGGISVELPGGFTPVLGDSFQVIESPSFKPPIYYFSAPPLPGGLELRPEVNQQGLAVRALCYADCDEDGALTIDDFLCFQTRFALDDMRADCQLNGFLTIDDFLCFQQKFALGCEFP